MLEESLLHSIIITPPLIEECSGVDASMFESEEAGAVFSAMVSLHKKGEPITLPTIMDEASGFVAASYIASLTECAPVNESFASFLSSLKRKWARRDFIEDVRIAITSGDNNVGPAITAALEKYDAKSAAEFGFSAVKSIIPTSLQDMQRSASIGAVVEGVPTGFLEIDALTGGLRPATLNVLAGRPSMGKTAMCLNIASFAALVAGVGVGVFSLEMSKEQLVTRLMCSESGEVYSDILFGKDATWNRLIKAANRLSLAPIYIDDAPAISSQSLIQRATSMKLKHNIGLIIIDYLQLMRSDKKTQSREREIAEISGDMKKLAKKLNIPVLALSQLNRGVEGRNDKRPMNSDLRESGAIEQDADLIAFIYRDEVYNKDSEDRGFAEFIISKQRNGPIGTVKLAFSGALTRFYNLSE